MPAISSCLLTTRVGRRFGEQYVGSGTNGLDFTGQTQDVTALNGGVYDFCFASTVPFRVDGSRLTLQE